MSMAACPTAFTTAARSKEGNFEDQVMIETAEQLYQAIEQMGRMQRILESYRNEILTRNPRNFAVLAEGPLEQLRQLQQQIDEYIQGLEASGTVGGT
jgi:hypothetical protein